MPELSVANHQEIPAGTQVVIPAKSGSVPAARNRFLNLDNIQTAELKLLMPLRAEIDALQTNRGSALVSYAGRIRTGYKNNTGNLREGFRLLSDSVDKGAQITVACACRMGSSGMCHADVVKMAIEKVNVHLNGRQTHNNEKLTKVAIQSHPPVNIENTTPQINPRTARAINEILALSESDRTLEKIDQTDGRNRSEQASHLGKSSQFIRDIYERGAQVIDGKLIIPAEKLEISPAIEITTNEYAVKRITTILNDELRAREIAPAIIESGHKIAGLTSDGETKLKVFTWVYDSLEGKSEFLKAEESTHLNENERFEKTLESIKTLARELHELEPADQLELVPLTSYEQAGYEEATSKETDESLDLEQIYEEALSLQMANERIEEIEQLSAETTIGEPTQNHSDEGKITTEGFERIDLNAQLPRIPAEFTESEINHLVILTLPEIDRQLEQGIPASEILKPFQQMIRQSAQDDALNKLERIYQQQQISGLEAKLLKEGVSLAEEEKSRQDLYRWQSAVLTPTRESVRLDFINFQSSPSQTRETNAKQPKTIAGLSRQSDTVSASVRKQLEKIDLYRENVIELKNPGEFLKAEEGARAAFYRQSKQEIGNLLTKIDQIKNEKEIQAPEKQAVLLKKELAELRDLKPSLAFKLKDSGEIIAGSASKSTIEERNFVSSYINYQLGKPETRLRHENERYRTFAARLEAATNREALIAAASEIRRENSFVGLNWKNLEKAEQEKLARPLTQKEMQFLFTESSPKSYTSEMTALRLSYAHTGASRRSVAESLMKGEIKPGPEAGKLIESLQERLQRRDLKDAIQATKHFFESIKQANDELKIKNNFDHAEVYRNLPPPEKDFVYLKAVAQKENLEYRVFFKQQEIERHRLPNRANLSNLKMSESEKQFHALSLLNQTRILGDKILTPEHSPATLTARDFQAAVILLKNEPAERISFLRDELKRAENPDNKKIGEILEVFNQANLVKDDEKTTISITLPENSHVSAEDYRELLEKLYPDEAHSGEKYKLSNFNEQTLAQSREKGQDEALRTLLQETKQNIYQAGANSKVFADEETLGNKLDEIKQFQALGRAARRGNNGILDKYTARVSNSLAEANKTLPTPAEQKEIVLSALNPAHQNTQSNKTGNEFFQAVQKEIKVGDALKFIENEKVISSLKTGIRKEFGEISELQKGLDESKLKTFNEPAKLSGLQQIYETAQREAENRLLSNGARVIFKDGEYSDTKTIAELINPENQDKIKSESFLEARDAVIREIQQFNEPGSDEKSLKLIENIEAAHSLSLSGMPEGELNKAFDLAEKEKERLQNRTEDTLTQNKPLSLMLYENEMARAEKTLAAESLKEKLSDQQRLSTNGDSLAPDTIFTPEERENFRLQAAELAKERLEPKELDADHRKISGIAMSHALATYKQLEQAHQTFIISGDKSKITEAFFKLDREAVLLNEVRANYDRAEKLAVLKQGIKTDIVDLIKKTPNLRGQDLKTQTGIILMRNFEKAGVLKSAAANPKIETLSHKIINHIDAKPKPAAKENSPFSQTSDPTNHIQLKESVSTSKSHEIRNEIHPPLR